MICIECNYKKEERGDPWLSLKPLKSFFGWSLLSARPNWDQLGWSVPLQNIVLASVGPKHGLLQLTNIRVCNRLALIKPFPGTSFDSMWLGTHWTRCPARPCSSWRTSTSSTYPSTKSSTSRRTPLLVTWTTFKPNFRRENLANDGKKVPEIKTEYIWLLGMDKLDTLNLNNNKIEELGPRFFEGDSSFNHLIDWWHLVRDAPCYFLEAGLQQDQDNSWWGLLWSWRLAKFDLS